MGRAVLLLNQLVAWEWRSVSAVGGCLFVSAGLHLHPLALLHVCPCIPRQGYRLVEGSFGHRKELPAPFARANVA